MCYILENSQLQNDIDTMIQQNKTNKILTYHEGFLYGYLFKIHRGEILLIRSDRGKLEFELTYDPYWKQFREAMGHIPKFSNIRCYIDDPREVVKLIMEGSDCDIRQLKNFLEKIFKPSTDELIIPTAVFNSVESIRGFLAIYKKTDYILSPDYIETEIDDDGPSQRYIQWRKNKNNKNSDDSDLCEEKKSSNILPRESSDDCAICLENVDIASCFFQCQHPYHNKCLVDWSKVVHTFKCPQCRAELKNETISDLGLSYSDDSDGDDSYDYSNDSNYAYCSDYNYHYRISRMEKMRYKMITVFLEEYDTINVKNYENMLSIILLLIKLKYNYTVKYDQTNYLKYSIILEN